MNKAISILKQIKDLSGWIKCGAELPYDNELDEVIAELEAQEGKSCEWSYKEWGDGDMWEGGCGVSWVMFDGTPKENHMNFCPKCGGKLIEKDT